MRSSRTGRFFHGYYRHYCYLPLYIFSGEHLPVPTTRRCECSNIDGEPRDRWRNPGTDRRAGFGRAGR